MHCLPQRLKSTFLKFFRLSWSKRDWSFKKCQKHWFYSLRQTELSHQIQLFRALAHCVVLPGAPLFNALFLQKGMARQLVVSKTWLSCVRYSTIPRKKGVRTIDGFGTLFTRKPGGASKQQCCYHHSGASRLATAAVAHEPDKKYWYSRPPSSCASI